MLIRIKKKTFKTNHLIALLSSERFRNHRFVIGWFYYIPGGENDYALLEMSRRTIKYETDWVLNAYLRILTTYSQ